MQRSELTVNAFAAEVFIRCQFQDAAEVLVSNGLSSFELIARSKFVIQVASPCTIAYLT